MLSRETLYSRGMSWTNIIKDVVNHIKHYLLKGILKVLDHHLGSDQTHELDEGVHVAQTEVSEGTVLDGTFISNVETQFGLEKLA